MEKSLHLKLLELMAIDGVGCNFDVVPFVTKYFAYPLREASSENEKQKGRIFFFFDDLVSRRFIVNEDANLPGWRYDRTNDNKVVITCTQDNLYYKITSEGLDYVDKNKILQTSKWANYSIITSLIITLLFSISTLVITGLNYSLSQKNYQVTVNNTNSDSLKALNVNKRLDTLTKVLQSLQKSLLSPKAQKPSR
jgi:hypothetical protein